MIEADVERAAALAKIALSAQEKAELARDLTRFIDYVDRLFAAEVPDQGMEPRSPSGLPAHTRDDIAQPTLGREALAGGPGFDGALVAVPKVI